MLMQNNVVRRFNVDCSSMKNISPGWIESFECQLKIVECAFMHPSILDNIRSTLIFIQPDEDFGARYRVDFGVEVGSLEMPLDRPVILHELMHAFHYSAIQGGFSNVDILKFYERALRFKIYPSGSYVLRSPQEFFAITATCLIHRRIKRPPFTVENLKNKQPNYHRWLSEILQLNFHRFMDNEI